MIRNFFMVLLLFIFYEGFLLLPKKLVVPFPGVFRMADSILLLIPLFFLFFFHSVVRVLIRFSEESLLILGATALVFLSPLMAWHIFDQPYWTGLLLMRHNFVYLSFFLFVLLLRPNDRLEKFLNLMTILFGVYIVILLVTKYIPALGLIHYREGYYEKIGGFMRFGESQLFFPYENVPILLYFLNLAAILHTTGKMSVPRKTSALVFILIVLFALLSTFTRILYISVLFATTFALFTSNRRMLRNLAIVLTVVIICAEGLVVAVSESGIPFIEESKLGKMVLQSSKLAPEEGRWFQVSMYMNNFVRSPITGVGNIASGTLDYERDNYGRTYRKYGLFNTTDIGYLKMAAENGMVGIAWVIWFYMYLYRQSKKTLKKAHALGDEPVAEAVALGLRYFLIYLAISGLTLPHFVDAPRIPAIVLALAIMAVTRESLKLRTAAAIA